MAQPAAFFGDLLRLEGGAGASDSEDASAEDAEDDHALYPRRQQPAGGSLGTVSGGHQAGQRGRKLEVGLKFLTRLR